MLGKTSFTSSTVLFVFLCFLFAACGTESWEGADGTAVSGVEGIAAPLVKGACDFRVDREARDYYPGTGKGSVRELALGLIDQMADACEVDDGAAFTNLWFDLAELTEAVVASGSGGDPVAGGTVFRTLALALGPDGVSPIFDPCGADDTECSAWEGYPSDVPDFARVLASPNGAWGVVDGGYDPVCSAFDNGADCLNWDPATQGDKWGVEPGKAQHGATWDGALHGRRSLLIGHPLESTTTPTGEALLGASLPAYRWVLVPEPDAFAVDADPPQILEVGACTSATSQNVDVIQKGGTILREADLDWCDTEATGVAAGPRTPFGSVLDFLSPAPAPLFAIAGKEGCCPGGSAGSFTDFYAGDVPVLAEIAISAQPADASVGQVIVGEDGEPFTILTFTSSEGTPTEDTAVTIRIVGNSGLIASGNDASGSEVECAEFVCTGSTQGDHDPQPGSLVPELVITKPGQYSACITATLAPLVFANEVCTDKFIINP